MGTSAHGQYGGIDAHPVVVTGSNHVHVATLPFTGLDLTVFLVGAALIIVVGFCLRRSA